MNFTFR